MTAMATGESPQLSMNWQGIERMLFLGDGHPSAVS